MKLKPIDKANLQESSETEEMNILRNVKNACRATEHRDAFAVFGYYIASTMRSLRSTIGQETMESWNIR